MNLHVFGCSLTHSETWKNSVASALNINLVDYSDGAASNCLMIKRFHYCVLEDLINKNDIIIWQITFPRISLRWIDNSHNRQKLEEFESPSFSYYNYVIKSKNFFDNQYRIDLLDNHPLITNQMHIDLDHCQDLETLTANLVLAKKMYPKLLVLLGWKDVIHCDYETKFWKKIEEHNIDCIKTPILNWVIDHDLPLIDDGHPTASSSLLYGEKVVVPKLQQLKWQ